MLTRQIATEKVHKLAPGETEICLYPPRAFTTVASQLQHNSDFWVEFGALHEIAPELALQIGDFGPGSDTPILLDYRRGHESVCVLRLEWPRPLPNRWALCADSFDEFAERLGIISSEERFPE